MTIVSRAQWGAKYAKGSSRIPGPIHGVTLHWEGPKMGNFPHTSCAGKVRSIERFHAITRGWAGIAYTAIVCPHGSVFEGRGVGVRSAANGTSSIGGNDHWYAVCYMSGQGDGFTDAGKAGMVEAVQWLRAKGGAGDKVNGHRDHHATECPGSEIYAWLQRTDFAPAKPVKRAVVKKPKPKPAPVRFVGILSIVQANFLKSNKYPAADARVLAKTHAHVIGLNEGRNFISTFRDIPGYRLVAPGSGAALNNPILLRADIKWLEEGTRKMCDKVGTSPERTATWVGYDYHGKRAHIQTHTNAHIENGGKPRVLPRVTQDVRHLANLTALVKELRGKGYKVTVGGDLNWAFKVGPVWASAPRLVFWRLGMYVNWANERTAPKGGTLGSRKIDYLAHSSKDLRIAGQHIVTGEHSDHRWLQVDYRIIAN